MATSKPNRRSTRTTSLVRPLTVAVVTGTRAEFGLLRPVMHAILKHKKLKLQVIAAGAHFLKPARTIREVEAEFPIAARVPMQGSGMPALRAGSSARLSDSLATARGVEGFTRAYAKLKPDWVVVLGDRIEAFAAASAASIGGVPVCHIHGGDRAEGIADEAMRHAITKLSHLHCAATKLSAERIIKMGEKPERVHVTGSPAIDGLKRIPDWGDDAARAFGSPLVIVLMHPSGDPNTPDWKWAGAAAVLASTVAHLLHPAPRGGAERVLYLAPNHDPGSDEMRQMFRDAVIEFEARSLEHLPREAFIGMLKRLARIGGVLIGNSSAGLIEAAALGVRVINLGPRQSGRERAGWIFDVPALPSEADVARLCATIQDGDWPTIGRGHPFGDGRASPRIAKLLANTNPRDPALLRKHNTY
ncbi:MAG: UDP-N-acetylglucosamine 2-epimerase (hydrolyzing) [Phycisphaerales bacterium]|nr:UDP-N-acetylglucosamine 2-epimerase (hydrolyzing) [Phycisphaerales bacterium]